MNSIPEGQMRDEALKRIEILDCSNTDKKLASCDSAATLPPAVLDWKNKLESASVDDTAYAKALAKEFRSLFCASDADAIHILRGVIVPSLRGASIPLLLPLLRGGVPLADTGRETPALMDFIMSKDCPVSVALTEDDKATLLEIKQDAEQ